MRLARNVHFNRACVLIEGEAVGDEGRERGGGGGEEVEGGVERARAAAAPGLVAVKDGALELQLFLPDEREMESDMTPAAPTRTTLPPPPVTRSESSRLPFEPTQS